MLSIPQHQHGAAGRACRCLLIVQEPSADVRPIAVLIVALRHNGRLHHIGIGRTHARTHVILLAHDLDVRIINAATGELLRELTIDPDGDYQPTGRPHGPPPKTSP